jgi:hypothetical protein
MSEGDFQVAFEIHRNRSTHLRPHRNRALLQQVLDRYNASSGDTRGSCRMLYRITEVER